MVPDENSLCKPVFVAHSLLSAIWLVRASLPDRDTLPKDAWARLVSAAESLASQGTEEAPPSAQKSVQSKMGNSHDVSLGSKRLALSEALPTPKRARPAEPQTQAAQAPSRASSLQVSDGSDLDELQSEKSALVTTVTSNNRRAERARNKKLEASHTKKRQALDLIAPGDKASLDERYAYTSLSPQDETVVAWIIKQPVSGKDDFYSAAQTPYRTALIFLEKTRALGSLNARFYARQFLQGWRERGAPFQRRLTGDLPRSQQQHDNHSLRSQRQDHADVEFCSAWDRCRRYESILAAVQIEYRWAEALLGQAYANKVAQIQRNDLASSNDKARNRYGKRLGPVGSHRSAA